MLTIARRASETILIGKDIKITVVTIGKNQVKIGIDAPSDLMVLRDDKKFKLEENPIPRVHKEGL
jgi:carbon storage regulator